LNIHGLFVHFSTFGSRKAYIYFQIILYRYLYLNTSIEVNGSLGKMGMAKFTMSLPEAMKKALEEEMKKRKLDSIQETIRSILSEYFSKA